MFKGSWNVNSYIDNFAASELYLLTENNDTKNKHPLP